LSKNDDHSYRWRENYIRTFVEKDILNLGINIPAENIRRFWMMLSNNHGGILNSSDLGKSLSITHNTVRRYLDILVGTFMVRQLYPWFENISKRQVKSPKIYIRDSGILHNLLQVKNSTELRQNLKLGASWEGFALEEVIKHHNFRSQDCYFWSTQNKAEIDLFVITNGKRVAYEFKFTDSPKITKSIRIAIEDLKLDQVYVLHPGNKKYHVEAKIIFSGLQNYLALDPSRV
jgi:predicted AAA+ superfamily ATPase